ncbi:MAG: putative 2OG-Fe(II) oxygenase [Pseudomonadota bacterium]
MSNELANVEQSLNHGDAEQALADAEAALSNRPNWPRAHMLAASAASRLGKDDEARRHLVICRDTLRHMPENVEAHLTIAALYTAIEDFQDALEVLEPVWQTVGDTPELLDAIAVNMHQADRVEEAVEVYKKLLKLEPENLNIHHNICAALLAIGKAKQAASFASKWLKLAPGDTEAISFRAVALEEAGNFSAAAALMDFQKFVTSEIIEPPEGFGSIDTFNTSLEIAILSHPDLSTPPEDSPHYHDPALKITDQILGPKTGPIADLEAMIRKEVDAYYAARTKPKTHPFIGAVPQQYELVAWAAVLDKQGNQDAHIHFDGHLSGCYYVRIPEEVSADDNGSDGLVAGGFEVGRPPPEFGCRSDHRHRVIKPQEGMMVLFPSYMYHQTIPFEAKERRICVAFDVMPR